MFSLLLLSAVLSASPAAAQVAVVSGDPLVAESTLQILTSSETPLMAQEPQGRSFDAMEIHPDSDICFKIRAYIFSTGPVPKLLRETTCGPKRPTAKSVEGTQPKFVPIDASEQPVVAPER
jgi:hypothetical protein